jgi:hypothetical protein
MSASSLAASPTPAAPVRPLFKPRDTASWVQLVLHRAQPPQSTLERRRVSRYPYPYPLQLIPVNRDNQPLPQETIFVLGKHLCTQGLDFYCAQPLAFRRAIISFDGPLERPIQLLMDLNWCRFCRHGWYENGGRFLQAILADTQAA